MAFFFFVDESGTDHQDSPYEVLCGISIQDSELWKIITQLKSLEIEVLGTRYSGANREIKGRNFLKRKVFKHASLEKAFAPKERTQLSKECIESGESATKKHFAALAQAKLEYVRRSLDLSREFNVKIFAAISKDPSRITDRESADLLRRDYVYVFERMYYFLEDKNKVEQGIVVFDELEKSQSHVLVSQLENYFKKTAKGRKRSSLIIPEPFFVHSDLTTGIQIADLIAYILCWGLRLKGMDGPIRKELDTFVEMVKPLRHITARETTHSQAQMIWSVTFIK
jgi:hypothetical protein